MVRSVLRAGDNIVPFQNVRFGWMGNDIRRRVFRDGFVFACQTLGGGFASHADDQQVLGDTKENGTDCGSREWQDVERRSSLKERSSLREGK
jgi:hypothetical protein